MQRDSVRENQVQVHAQVRQIKARERHTHYKRQNELSSNREDGNMNDQWSYASSNSSDGGGMTWRKLATAYGLPKKSEVKSMANLDTFWTLADL